MKDYKETAELLKAIGHPVRLRLVEGLLTCECNVNKMVKKLDLPQSTVSQHLAVLNKCGILQIRKDGVKTCYKVVDKKVAELIKVLNEGR